MLIDDIILNQEQKNKLINIIDVQIPQFIKYEILPNIFEDITIVFQDCWYFKVHPYFQKDRLYAQLTYGVVDGYCVYCLPLSSTNTCRLDILMDVVNNWDFIKKHLLIQVDLQQKILGSLDNFQL